MHRFFRITTLYVLMVQVLGLQVQSAYFSSETATSSYETNGTVYLVNGSPMFKPGIVDRRNGVAYGLFTDGLLLNGWGVLDIKSGYSSDFGSNYADADVTMAAGYLEGALTWKHIYAHYTNMLPVFIKPDTPPTVLTKLKSYFGVQQRWMENQVAQNPSDPFWKAVGLVLNQYEGLYKGYNAAAPSDKKLDLFAFQILNYAGDLLDLMHVVDKDSRPDFEKMTKEQLKSYIQRNSHCSALIKVLPAYENIFFSHSSWFVYQGTNRIYKFYNLSVSDFSSPGISFSSYPGYLESLDDFYIMSNGLVMLQTTNSLFNMTLYDLVTAASVPAWIRVRVANHMARNSSEWARYVSPHNSGTYNNQYMVLDLNRIRLGESIEDEALYVVEQIPGLIEFSDQTDLLRLGYWPSYNVPFHETIYNISGFPEQVASKGTDFSYQLAPRAKIFRRDAAKVTNMDSMKRIMRYNGYKTDAYTEDDPCNTICCRGDLRSKGAAPLGCYDTKVSDYFMAATGSAWIVNGPTTAAGADANPLKPFSWSQFSNTSHAGLPPVYNFDFIQVKMTP